MKLLEAASMGFVGVLGVVAAAVVAVGIVDFATDLAEAEKHERLLSKATMEPQRHNGDGIGPGRAVRCRDR